MLRQIKWELQNGPIKKNGVLPVTALSFWKKMFSVSEPLIKSWFVVPTTQMPIFVSFVSPGVSFDSDFFLWVSFSSNDDKIMQSIDSIETNRYGVNKDLVCKNK